MEKPADDKVPFIHPTWIRLHRPSLTLHSKAVAPLFRPDFRIIKRKLFWSPR